MNKAIRIIVSILLITGGIVVLGFAAPLLQSSNVESIVGFLILAALSTVVAISGFRIARGERMRDVFSDLFRGIGR